MLLRKNLQMNKINFFKGCLLVAVFVGMMTFSCCDDENPCKDINPITADFVIQQRLIDIDSVFSVDTVLLRYDRGIHFDVRIYFSAAEENATYQWKVGNDLRTFTQKEFFLDFDAPYGEMEVTLVVNKQPNTSCNPTDDGVDTATHKFFLLSDQNFPYRFEGVFTGSHTDSPTDVFDITIVDFGPTPQNPSYDPGYYDLRIFNLPKGCGAGEMNPGNYSPGIKEYTYRQFYFSDTGATDEGDCPALSNGLGKLWNDDNTIMIDYTIQKVDNGTISYVEKRFIGTRKN